MNNFIQNYEIVLKQLREFDICSEPFMQIRKPRLTNLELICLNLTAEYMGIDSENQLFRVISSTYLSKKIERSVYNRRKRKLFDLIERIRSVLASNFNKNEKVFIVDSMPLEICKNARANRSSICKEFEYSAPNRGFCASQKAYYYGYKLHGICSVSGVFHSIDITPASVHDIRILADVKQQLKNCSLLGDRGYLSSEVQIDLFNSANIILETPKRRNQHDFKEQPYIFKKSRKRIETLYSQLCDQFMIRRNYAKTFEGFKTRILSKITAMTVIQYINKVLFDRPINQLKVNLA